MNLRKTGKVFTSKCVGTGPSSYKKRIYRAAVSQRLRNTVLSRIFARFNSFLRYSGESRTVHTFEVAIRMPLLFEK